MAHDFLLHDYLGRSFCSCCRRERTVRIRVEGAEPGDLHLGLKEFQDEAAAAQHTLALCHMMEGAQSE